MNTHPQTFSPKSLSICMIVKNEARFLARCLESCRDIADEIVINDTGSTDATVEIARSHGARVIVSEWKNDFSYSRNISLRGASCAWILWLDADDVVPLQSIPIINDLKKSGPDKVFGFVVRNQKPGNTGTEFVQARMFPNDPRICFERRIHEQMMLSALRIGLKLVPTQAVVEHHGYADPEALNRKAARNIGLLLEEYTMSGPDPVMAVEIADSYLITGNDGEALQWYRTVLEIPHCEAAFPHIAAQAYLGWGNILNKAYDLENATEKFHRALALSPGRADALFSLAVTLDLQDRKEEALERLKQIVSAPAAPLAVGVDFREAKIKSLLRMERLLYDLGRNGETMELAHQALGEFRHRPEIQNMAGRIFIRNDKLMDALHAFEKSLQIDTARNVDAYIGLCKVYLKAEKKETASQTMESIRPLFEKFSRYWAFYKILYGAIPAGVVPDLVDIKEVDKEIGYLNRIY
jgi:glycosyltransferase involved in cell wall biosynthesis